VRETDRANVESDAGAVDAKQRIQRIALIAPRRLRTSVDQQSRNFEVCVKQIERTLNPMLAQLMPNSESSGLR
jgi:hypothetical protein